MGLTRVLVCAKARARLLVAASLAAVALLIVLQLPGSVAAQTVPQTQSDWQSDPSYTINFLGRDSSQGPDRYHVVFGIGTTFFGIAVNAMPLLPADQSVAILMDGFKTAFPDHQPQDIQPDDGFDFLAPLGTVVSTKWRKSANSIEYPSLRGDDLVLYTDPKSLISYRLVRVEDSTHAQVVLNKDMQPNSFELAKAVYGMDDPNFRPDVLQVARAGKAIQENQDSISVDLTSIYLDDFPAIRDKAEKGGLAVSGLQIYWFRSDQLAQPLFRVDDGVGQATDPSGLPSLMRVYYYKDGVVRTYQRAGDTVMLSGRQPRNDEWAQVFAQYGQVTPAPDHWEIGQPEDSPVAQELSQLGIVVLRYEPKDVPKSNLFTQFLDWVMSLMKRSQSS
jgi:hypothetical protein